MFRGLIPLLADQFHVIAPDYVGFGYSDAPPSGRFRYTFDNLATVTDKFLERVGLTNYVLYMQDYGGPIGFCIALAHPERVAGLVIQNANAYDEGFGPGVLDALKPLWEKRTAETEARVREFISSEGIRRQYVTGAQNPEALSPDSWTLASALIRRPGHEAIELDMLADYHTNLASNDAWHAYLRRYKPRTLIAWGKNDPIFIAPGAEAYRRDLPDAELLWLDGGHFALEEHAVEVASAIRRVFGSRPK